MNRKTLARVGAVLGGYAASLCVAVVVVQMRQSQTSGPREQASAGMHAFGDLILFVFVFAVLALIPTALWVWFLRHRNK